MLKKLLTIMLVSSSAFSQANENIGNDINKVEVAYEQLSDHEFTQKAPEGTQYEVLYFFNYGCTYCNSFERYLDIYLENTKNINFVYKPIMVQESWHEYAKAFYVAENLELDFSKSHKGLFNAVHKENQKLLTKESLDNYFLKEYNVDLGKLHSAYNSYSVTYKLNKNEELADKFDVTGTPTIIVISKDGKTYKVSPSISGSVFSMVTTLVLLTN